MTPAVHIHSGGYSFGDGAEAVQCRLQARNLSQDSQVRWWQILDLPAGGLTGLCCSGSTWRMRITCRAKPISTGTNLCFCQYWRSGSGIITTRFERCFDLNNLYLIYNINFQPALRKHIPLLLNRYIPCGKLFDLSSKYVQTQVGQIRWYQYILFGSGSGSGCIAAHLGRLHPVPVQNRPDLPTLISS
jgi:hypothetical protein